MTRPTNPPPGLGICLDYDKSRAGSIYAWPHAHGEWLREESILVAGNPPPPRPIVWIKTSTQRPPAGALIVKRWKNGSVWAGRYSGSEKDSAFDEWYLLPE